MPTRRPALPFPGDNYNRQVFDQWIKVLDKYFATIDNPGDSIVSSLRILNPSYSGGGLDVGAVWLNNGVLTVVEANKAYASSQSITLTLGTVTVTT